MKLKANREDAKKVAQALASSLKEKGIDTAVDRNGYLYHGGDCIFCQDCSKEEAGKFKVYKGGGVWCQKHQ